MPGPSNWTTAFTHPDPMDPNDRVRQKTHSRDVTWPYDRDTSYGASSHAGMDGSERQDGASNGPPLARTHKAPRPMSVWDRMSDSIDRLEGLPYLSNGPETELSAMFGYGSHGRMGEDEEETTSSLLSLLDPEEIVDSDEQDEARDTYGCWAGRVIGREE